MHPASVLPFTALVIFGFVATLAQLAAAAKWEQGEAFVLRNGTVYTMSSDLPYASALCVSEGRIQAVGSDAKVLASLCGRASASAAAAGRGAGILDLQGATVLPGLTDSHAHLVNEATRRLRADLLGSASAAEAAQLAKAFADAHPELVKASGGWVAGFGWQESGWPGGAFPTREDLDGLFPDVPVFLQHVSGHACWVNSKALEVVGKDLPAVGDPPGGHIERDAAGRPTGVLSDGAQDIVEAHIQPFTTKVTADALSEVLRDCASHGLTGVHDLDALRSHIQLYQQFHEQGDLTLRVYAAIDGRAADSSPKELIESEDGLLTRRAVKFFADGALGSWSAAMLQPYSDKPGETGTLVYSHEALLSNLSVWAAEGNQLITHAIGDAANRQLLDVYEHLLANLRRSSGGASTEDLRWRVEHAQILAQEDIPRFAALGVIPSMQPSHCAADLPYALQRLGPERVAGSYAWQSVLSTGVKALPFGSDFPTAGSIPPVLGLHAAVTRQTPEGVPLGGWHPEQRVTREQAVRGYTVDAAYASFREHELGMLLPGFLADITIFDRDVLTVEASQILGATAIGTIVGGRVVHPLADQAGLAQAIGSSTRPGVVRDLAALARIGGRGRGTEGRAAARSTDLKIEGADLWRSYADSVLEELPPHEPVLEIWM